MTHKIIHEGITYAALSDRGKQLTAALFQERVAYWQKLVTAWSLMVAIAPLSAVTFA